MEMARLVDSLDRFGQYLPGVVKSVAPDDAGWRPSSDAWSILEIVCHLGDEEEFDFRRRTELTLADPRQPWPTIDPVGWAIERRYNDGELTVALNRFVTLRRESVAWLRSLDDPDWSKTYEHPKLGPIRAGDVFVAWAAHDMLHLRQISKRMYQLIDRDAGPYSIAYAGDWGP